MEARKRDKKSSAAKSDPRNLEKIETSSVSVQNELLYYT